MKRKITLLFIVFAMLLTGVAHAAFGRVSCAVGMDYRIDMTAQKETVIFAASATEVLAGADNVSNIFVRAIAVDSNGTIWGNESTTLHNVLRAYVSGEEVVTENNCSIHVEAQARTRYSDDTVSEVYNMTKSRVFNKIFRSNSNTKSIEEIYADLKQQEVQILNEHGLGQSDYVSFLEIMKDEKNVKISKFSSIVFEYRLGLAIGDKVPSGVYVHEDNVYIVSISDGVVNEYKLNEDGSYMLNAFIE